MVEQKVLPFHLAFAFGQNRNYRFENFVSIRNEGWRTEEKMEMKKKQIIVNS